MSSKFNINSNNRGADPKSGQLNSGPGSLAPSVVSFTELDSGARGFDREEIWNRLGCDSSADYRGAGVGRHPLGVVRFAIAAQVIAPTRTMLN
jgi:hypothetical protein